MEVVEFIDAIKTAGTGKTLRVFIQPFLYSFCGSAHSRGGSGCHINWHSAFVQIFTGETQSRRVMARCTAEFKSQFSQD